MRRPALLLLAAAALELTSCAATLRMGATAPSQDNDGTCTSPVLVAAPNAPRIVHFRWVGPVAGEDSVAVTSGQLATLQRNVTPGQYVVYGWASDAGGAGCVDSVRVTIKAAPWRVVMQ